MDGEKIYASCPVPLRGSGKRADNLSTKHVKLIIKKRFFCQIMFFTAGRFSLFCQINTVRYPSQRIVT
ncbi:MAG: hypothetical protein D3909_15070 [Candidatus Electrothrix sp. ATG1]|nr:hypothetical protein [Candidatus Electrothrix sp. ATG1]